MLIVELPTEEHVAEAELMVGTDGVELTVTVTSSKQDESLDVHLKILVPIAKPETEDVGLLMLEKVPKPEITDHVPDAGAVAAKLVVVKPQRF